MADYIDKTNLVSEPRNVIVDFIKENVSNPAGLKKWIYSRDPDVKSLDFKGFPFIIVKLEEVSTDEDKGGEYLKKISHMLSIEFVSADAGYLKGKGLYYIDKLSNDIFNLFVLRENRQELRQKGLSFSNPDITRIVDEEYHKTKIYRRFMTVSFQSMKKV